MARKLFSDEVLGNVRRLPLSDALKGLRDLGLLFFRRDNDFRPTDPASLRLYVSLADGSRVFELVITGVKWCDSQTGEGGGGSIDLVKHLLDLDFVKAVKLLQKILGTSPGEFR